MATQGKAAAHAAESPTTRLIADLTAEVGKVEAAKEATREMRSLVAGAVKLHEHEKDFGLPRALVDTEMLEALKVKLGDASGSARVSELAAKASSMVVLAGDRDLASTLGLSKANVEALTALVERAGKATRATRGSGGGGDGHTLVEGNRNAPGPVRVSCAQGCKEENGSPKVLTEGTRDLDSIMSKVIGGDTAKGREQGLHHDTVIHGGKFGRESRKEARTAILGGGPGKSYAVGGYTFTILPAAVPAAS